MRIERLRQRHALQIDWRAYPLHPEVPDAGMRLYDLFYGRIDLESVLARLEGVAAELGLPLAERTMTYNSRRAQELGKWATAQGIGEAYHQAVYHAYFAAGRNIARPEVLTAICADLGLDPAAASAALESGDYAEAVDADWQLASERGVTAVPTVQLGDATLVGFQDDAAYERLFGEPAD